MGWSPFHGKPHEPRKTVSWTTRPDGISVLSSAKAESLQVGVRDNALFLVHEAGAIDVDHPGWLRGHHVPGVLNAMSREMEQNPERFEALLEGTSGAGKGLVPKLSKALREQPERNELKTIAFKALGDGDHERALLAVKMIIKLDKNALGWQAR